MAETQEYKTLKKYVPHLRSAVQADLITLSEELRSKGLISEENKVRLKDESHSKEIRAANLVAIIMNTVKLNPACYNVFVKVLHDSGNAVIPLIEQDKPRNVPHRVSHCSVP